MRDTVAILLAGGVGTRLNVLVRHRAKPAVPFGGVYRIIDFTLSSVANSGIDLVAVLTQYRPLSLMDHIGNGSSWDLAGRNRGIRILPPKTGEEDWDWYRGTADAVRQNLSFLTSKTNDYVLIVSGDHVYHMDYREMITFHREQNAEVTIAMIGVPWEETHQFGTAIVDRKGRIVEWEEKSPKAKSNLASMGIYVFNREYLVRTLEETKEADFGHHIIPKALREAAVFAFPFDGYWRDVGTIQAYWDANMDLLDPLSGIDPEQWRIMTNLSAEGLPYDRPPARIGGGASVVNSIVSPGCVIRGMVKNSVLSPGVVVDEAAVVADSVVMHDCRIGRNGVVDRAVLDKEVVVGSGAVVGSGIEMTVVNKIFPQHLYSGITLCGKRASVPEGVSVGRNCVVFPSAGQDDFSTSFVASGENVEGRE